MLAPIQDDDACAILEHIDWKNESLKQLEDSLVNRAKQLYEQNIVFLLEWQESLDKEEDLHGDHKVLELVNDYNTKLYDIDEWFDGFEHGLNKAHNTIQEIERLNSHLDIQSNNSTALEIKLSTIIENISLESSHLKRLNNAEELLSQGSLRELISSMEALYKAMLSCQEVPACHLSAVVFKGEELRQTANAFCLQFSKYYNKIINNLSIEWIEVLNTKKVAQTKSTASYRASNVLDTEKDEEFLRRRNSFHQALFKYQNILQILGKISVEHMDKLLEQYIDVVAPIYRLYMKSKAISLKEKLKNTIKITKLSNLSSYSLVPSTGSKDKEQDKDNTIECTHSMVFSQYLTKILPLLNREQQIFQELYFQLEEETLLHLMEKLFSKLLKRLNEFSDAANNSDIFQVITIILLLKPYRIDCKFNYQKTILDAIHIRLQQMVSKYAEEQKSWIMSLRQDTRQAGVLLPFLKFPTLVEKLLEITKNKQEETVTDLYNRICPSLFKWLEKTCLIQPKYADIVRLENYSFFFESLQTKRIEALDEYLTEALTIYTQSMEKYILWLWKCQYEKTNDFFEQIEGYLKTLRPSEVQYHITKQSFIKEKENINKTMFKSINSVHERMKKHLGAGNRLKVVAWEKFMEHVVHKYSRYIEIGRLCYEVILEPSLPLVQENLRSHLST